MFVLGRSIVYDRSTACARDACLRNFFPRDCKNTLVKYRFALKFKARIISTVVQYHCSLDSRKWPDCSLEPESLLPTKSVCDHCWKFRSLLEIQQLIATNVRIGGNITLNARLLGYHSRPICRLCRVARDKVYIAANDEILLR